jgi:hypothetical protein
LQRTFDAVPMQDSDSQTILLVTSVTQKGMVLLT